MIETPLDQPATDQNGADQPGTHRPVFREPVSVVILAAGKGTRMRNGIAKVLHPLAGQPLIWHVLRQARALGCVDPVVVLAPGMEEVRAAVERAAPGARIVIQETALGTGDAVRAAAGVVAANGTALVLFGDTPLLRPETAASLVTAREAADAAVSVLGIRPPDPAGYGRLEVAGPELTAIVEERHAPAELLRSGACNAGVMAFAAARLPELLAALPLREGKNEYYLTDAVHLARARGWRCVAVEGPWQDGIGINSQAQLAEAEAVFQARRRRALLAEGVIMQAPQTVFLAADTAIEPGAVIEPYVIFGAEVRVERGAVIHAFSHLEGARVAAGASVGPFARLRPGTSLAEKARVGNFVELKNAVLEAGAKANHLTYLGDALVGAGANVGAGTITCNYDGVGKHRTAIGRGAFIGSNTALVAPVEIGAEAIVAAGSTITQPVPPGALAVGRARQATLPERAGPLRDKLRQRR